MFLVRCCCVRFPKSVRHTGCASLYGVSSLESTDGCLRGVEMGRREVLYPRKHTLTPLHRKKKIMAAMHAAVTANITGAGSERTTAPAGEVFMLNCTVLFCVTYRMQRLC